MATHLVLLLLMTIYSVSSSGQALSEEVNVKYLNELNRQVRAEYPNAEVFSIQVELKEANSFNVYFSFNIDGLRRATYLVETIDNQRIISKSIHDMPEGYASLDPNSFMWPTTFLLIENFNFIELVKKAYAQIDEDVVIDIATIHRTVYPNAPVLLSAFYYLKSDIYRLKQLQVVFDVSSGSPVKL